MFKVGDRVRVKITIGKVQAGAEGEIVSINSSIWPYKVLCDDKQELICIQTEIELILPMPQTQNPKPITRRFVNQIGSWVILERTVSLNWICVDKSPGVAISLGESFSVIADFEQKYVMFKEDGWYAIRGVASPQPQYISNSQPKVAWDNLFGAKPKSNVSQCNHQWKRYIGFTHRYDFCTQCPAKRDIAS